LEHPVDAFIQDRLRGMLENRDARDDLPAIAPAMPIGQQQNANGERDQTQAERKPFDDEEHKTPAVVIERDAK
jgi:hypothetical protein